MNKVIFGFVFVLLGQAKAIQFEGFEFPAEIKIENERLVLNGTALRKATLFGIRVLAAGLYLPEVSSDSSVIEKMEGRKQLHLYFLKNLPAKTITKTWIEELMKNCDNSCHIVKIKAQALETIISDIKKNDHLTVTFEKDRIVFQINQQKEDRIDGAEFGLAFLRIWVGPHPINEEFKQDLLKQFNKKGEEK